MRVIEKGSGEKGEGRGDLFWGRWALNVKQNFVDMAIHWHYFTMNSSL